MNRSAVSPHSLIHVRKELYVSQQWGKSPRIEEYLSTHNDIHTTWKICDRGKPFSNVFNLRWQNMTQPREKICECHPCGKGFCQISELRNHNPMHNGEKPDECGKAFSHGFFLDSMRPSTQERNHRNVPYEIHKFITESERREGLWWCVPWRIVTQIGGSADPGRS
ncbi:hypothetical protein QTO34_016475 [Cnephaeus nilssonii]|uniref:C2H2-type domain-containing protein n=1 Tax=Cnephaeus nilssonii TaxID=3371016 RepID=A0AA40I390_CNENI|nr:hypothetical protein QTO34_016475 [Eptesicus nilssonii]